MKFSIAKRHFFKIKNNIVFASRLRAATYKASSYALQQIRKLFASLIPRAKQKRTCPTQDSRYPHLHACQFITGKSKIPNSPAPLLICTLQPLRRVFMCSFLHILSCRNLKILSNFKHSKGTYRHFSHQTSYSRLLIRAYEKFFRFPRILPRKTPHFSTKNACLSIYENARTRRGA